MTELIERTSGERKRTIEICLEWAKKEERISKQMRRNGVNTIYSIEKQKGNQVKSIRILESRGNYSLMVNGQITHRANSLIALEIRGRLAGILEKDDRIIPAKTTRTKN